MCAKMNRKKGVSAMRIDEKEEEEEEEQEGEEYMFIMLFPNLLCFL